MGLRDYQLEAFSAATREFRAGKRRIVLVAPTGAGKTVIGCEFVRRIAERGGRVLWLTHRRELIRQAGERLVREGLTDLHVCAASGMVGHPSAPITVASVSTIYSRKLAPRADVVVWDECHHTVARTYKAIADEYPNAVHLGLTATPERSDKRPLGDVFDAMVVVASYKRLIEAGHLCPIEVVAPPARVEGGLAEDPAAALARIAPGRPAVVFCSSVPAAKELALRIPRAACVDGLSKTRDADLAAFARGDLDVLTNVHVLTEGWDSPRAEVCMLARGCGADGTFLQMVGRVMRPFEGKARALLIDLAGVVWEHGLPDDPREYSLHGRAISSVAALPALRLCPMCGRTARSTPVCARCGYEWPPPEPPKIVPSSLAAVHSIASRAERNAAFDELVQEARTKGYRPGWVGMRFKERFGFWPANLQEAFQ